MKINRYLKIKSWIYLISTLYLFCVCDSLYPTLFKSLILSKYVYIILVYITCHGSSNGKSVLALNKVFFSSKQIFFLQLSLLSSIYITFSPYKHIPYPSLFPFLFLLSLFFITFLFPFPYDLFLNIHVYMFLLSLWSLFFFLSKPFIPFPSPWVWF